MRYVKEIWDNLKLDEKVLTILFGLLVVQFIYQAIPNSAVYEILRQAGYRKMFPFSGQLITPKTYAWILAIKIGDVVFHYCLSLYAKNKTPFYYLLFAKAALVLEYTLNYNEAWFTLPMYFIGWIGFCGYLFMYFKGSLTPDLIRPKLIFSLIVLSLIKEPVDFNFDLIYALILLAFIGKIYWNRL